MPGYIRLTYSCGHTITKYSQISNDAMRRVVKRCRTKPCPNCVNNESIPPVVQRHTPSLGEDSNSPSFCSKGGTQLSAAISPKGDLSAPRAEVTPDDGSNCQVDEVDASSKP